MRKQYSDRQKVKALGIAARIGNYEEAARQTGISSGAVIANWAKGKGVSEEIVMTHKQKMDLEADEHRERRLSLLRSVSDDVIATGSLAERVNAVKTLLGTEMTLRGQASPDAVALSGKTPEEVAALQASAMAKLAELGVLQNTHGVDDGADA